MSDGMFFFQVEEHLCSCLTGGVNQDCVQMFRIPAFCLGSLLLLALVIRYREQRQNIHLALLNADLLILRASMSELESRYSVISWPNIIY